ncbi:hypothetical protein TCAL_15994 [Tigriopus californicus]|uniref:Uncharacterized protein n=1 Tax=Tigriopus californicus TaxID=6832 RepID=A0A553PHK0_TIGCA|nr:hypothetical protein TCAL_15994 [Tigriopus californicus]
MQDLLFQDEHPSNEWSSGALVLDLAFTQPESVSEIRFRNFYTAKFTLLLRFDDSVQTVPKREHLAWAAAASLSLARLRGVNSTEGIKIVTSSKSLSDWVVSLQSKVLMPDPHSELGSQDVGVVPSSESLAPWHDITAMRFLLRQPSPNWKTFNLEDIMVFRYPLGNAKGLSLRSPTLGTVPEREANDQECRPKSELESLIQQTQSLLMESLRIHNGEIRNNENPGHSVYEIMSLQLGQ